MARALPALTGATGTEQYSLNIGIVFAGQGSQSVGMLGELAAVWPEVRQTFDIASEALGEDLWSLSQTGPEARLNDTRITQPALLAAGIAVWRVWQQAGGPAPVAMAGHSLGEYTALVAADALDFTDAIRLVARRGVLMQAAVPAGEGAMAALLGLEDAVVAEICAAAAGEQVVEPVNFNAPGQVVIAGQAEAVERAMAAAREAGARKAMLLPVSVPSHCGLMREAAAELAAALEEVEIRPPRVPVIHNVDATTRTEPAAIRQVLAAQLHQPVRWTQCMQQLIATPVSLLVEAGPGRVLTGLAKRIDRSVPAVAVHDPATLTAALEQTQEARA